MLRFSTCHERSLYSSSNVPSNPPLTTILEQCFWSENSDKYFFINKYNQQCAARNSSKSRKKFASLSKRPSTTNGRFYHCRTSSLGGYGEGFSQSNSSQVCEDQSRSSTPDFMQEVYDAYSNLDSDNEKLLLRRPISQSGRNSKTSASSLELVIQSERRNSSPAIVERNNICSTPEIEEVIPVRNLPNEKKTVKVAIDIPSCEKHLSNQGLKYDVMPDDNSPIVNVEEILPCDNVDDDVQSVQSCVSNDSSKSKSTSKKNRTKKKKSRLKKKVDMSTVSLDYSRVNQHVHPPPKPVWRSNDDDVVTQMSALGLSKRSDDEFTKTSSRISSKPDVKSNSSNRSSRINTKLSIQTNASFTQNDVSSTTRSRRIPIQIISDPFMGSGDKDASQQRMKKRPLSGGHFSTARHYGNTTCWR